MNRQILLIGIGQFGCAVADTFSRACRPEDGPIRILAIDSDARTAEQVQSAPVLSFAYPCRIADVINEVDTDLLKTWFPCDRDNDCVEYFETMSMNEGANQWRMKGLLSFYYFLSKQKNRQQLLDQVRDIMKPGEEPPASVEIITVASLSGGTGSALYLPLTLYLKKLFRDYGIANVTARACLALPDLCEETMTREQQIKARANAYASLRELNAVTRNALGLSEPFSFRIGCEEDPVFGLLYDAEDPAFREADALPFRQAYLFRRIPGVNSMSGQISFLADAVRSICNEQPPTLPKNEGIYAGISLTKTVFPAEEFVSYIAESDFCRIAGSQWFHLYRTAMQEYKRIEKDTARNFGAEEIREGAKLGQAVYNAVRTICSDERSGRCRLLNRPECPDEEDFTPEDLLPIDFRTRLDEAMQEFFSCSAERQIKDFIEEQTATEDEDGNPIKKKKDSLFGREKRRNEMIDQILEQTGLLQEFYDHARARLEEMKTWDTFLFPEELSFSELVLQEEGQHLHPAIALARMAELREELLSSIRVSAKNLTATQRNWKEGKMPQWIMQAEITVRTKSRYSKEGVFRFAKTVLGEADHVGGKQTDMALFCYDLQVSLTRMRTALQTMYTELIILRLERWIEKYAELLRTTEKLVLDRQEDLNEERSERRFRTPVYRISDTPEEKRNLYRKYVAETDAEDPASPRLERTDNLLGFGFETILKQQYLIPEKAEDPYGLENDAEALLRKITKIIRDECREEDFCKDLLSRNVMAALLTRDPKNGGDSVSLALSKALSSGVEPLIFVVPEAQSAAPLSRTVNRSVSVFLPLQAKDYLQHVSPAYGNATPEGILNRFLSEAGEHEAVPGFTNALPHGEIRVLRKTEGLKLTFLEAFSETSDDPSGYKAYRKALKMEWEQTTALWNPHLVRGMGEGSLPPISVS